MDNFSMAMLGKNASFRSLNTNKKLARSIEKYLHLYQYLEIVIETSSQANYCAEIPA